MVPAGYNAKIIERPEDWLDNSVVTEILSVSGCISASPIDGTVLWNWNKWWLYDSEKELEKAIAASEVDTSNLRRFFYEVHDEECMHGGWSRIADLPTQAIKPKEGYSLRGFDIVTFCTHIGFGHSPLSCNLGADIYPVNQACLVETFEEAVSVAHKIAKDGNYEPGPYRVMSVWEKSS